MLFAISELKMRSTASISETFAVPAIAEGIALLSVGILGPKMANKGYLRFFSSSVNWSSGLGAGAVAVVSFFAVS